MESISSPSSSVSSSPDQQQHHNSLPQQQHDQLHIVVEPQPDGLTNVIHLINPSTGIVLSSILAEHGAHIEIQPGFIFRVPYPQVHSYQPYHNQQFTNNTGGGYNIGPAMMPTPNLQGNMPGFINPVCPIHGSPPSTQQQHLTNDERLERRREKLQRKLREKQKLHCCCNNGVQSGGDPNLVYNNPNHHEQIYQTRGNGNYYKTQHQGNNSGRRSQYQQNQRGSNFNDISNNNNIDLATNSVDGLEEDSMDEKFEIEVVVLPEVEIIDSANLKVSWSESITNNNHLSSHKFELQMSSNGAQFRTIYLGDDVDYTVTSLNPATEYNFRICVHVGDKRGKFSEAVSEKTSCSVPEKPCPPRVIQKTKTSLLLKWSAPKDGGKPISSYQLQWNKGDGSNEFEDLYVGNLRQYKLSHSLPAGTPCKFKLSASNELGPSDLSQLLECYTSASPPEAVTGVELVKTGTTYLTLSWKEPENNGAPITEYKLEMDNSATGYGFMASYCGDQKQYTCRNLLRNTSYKFRVCACNVQGAGKYSPIVSYGTNPETPCRMDKPKIIGKAKTHSLVIGWDPPKDSGGSEVSNYIIEGDEGTGGEFKELYCGNLLEYLLDSLIPGQTYRVRAASESVAGRSSWSPIAHMTTLPVCPCKPTPPQLSKKQREEATALHLEWDVPVSDGGAPVIKYVVKKGKDMSFEDSDEIYSGNQRHCQVRDLRPGTSYTFRLQATNRAGSSPPSDTITHCTAASAPDAPINLNATSKSHLQLCLEWEEPRTNGCPVTKYCVEQLKKNNFVQIYEGAEQCCDVRKGLAPATSYSFRVQAHSSAGSSPYSDVSSFTTSPAAPAAVSVLEIIKQKSDSVKLRWKHPENHGSNIHGYNVEISGPTTFSNFVSINEQFNLLTNDDNDAIEENNDDEKDDNTDNLSTEEDNDDNDNEKLDDEDINIPNNEYCTTTISGLTADTSYRARVQAVNKIGTGAFSQAASFVTTELPPDAPTIELVTASYHSLKMKWAEINSKRQNYVLNYVLQIENNSGRFVESYVGHAHSFSVGKLEELTKYTFRIAASNDAGQGRFSQPFTFTTKAQPPNNVKDLTLKQTSDSSVQLSWSLLDPLRSSDRVEYIVEENSNMKTKDYVKVYRGAEPSCELRSPALEINVNYRICAVRCLSQAQRTEIKGQWVNITRHGRSRKPEITSLEANLSENDKITTLDSISTESKTQFSDSQVALCILGFFLGICSIIAFLLWMFLS